MVRGCLFRGLMRAYYNENDQEKAAWLRELIKEGIIAPGEVDERSIKEVWPEDLRGFTQCHFFAGIGVWSYALRLAGWPDDRPVWTGSCPCPSFSAAGKGEGFDDPRHLWPDWARLIRKCKPATLFGEQADDAIGYGWLDLVQTDLERENYAVGKAVLGACSVGAPHIRQRLYFVAAEHPERGTEYEIIANTPRGRGPRRRIATERLENSDRGRRSSRESAAAAYRHGSSAIAASTFGDVEHSKRDRRRQGPEVFCERESFVPGAGEGISLGDSRTTGLSQRECYGSLQQFTLES